MMQALAAPADGVIDVRQPAPAEASDLPKLRRWLRAFESNKNDEQTEARIARQYYHDNQWSDVEKQKLQSRGQPVIWSNRIKRKIDFLVGIEQRNRRDPKAYPRGPEDEHSADVATATLRFVCDQSRWPKAASDVTHDGMVTGIGVVWIGAEQKGMGPDPVIRWCDPTRFFYDSRSIAPDFSDARHMGMHLWLDIEEAVERWPHKETELRSMIDTLSGGVMLLAERDQDKQWGDYERQRVRVVEVYYRKAAPTLTGYAWNYCVFSGDVELECGWSPYVDEHGVPDCPYEAWSPYVDEKGNRYGLVRSMRPIQDEVNHRRSKLLHLLNVRQVHYRKGAIDDVDEFRRQAARPDGVLEYMGEWGVDVGFVDHGQEIQGQAELLTEAKAELENLGPNPGLIGKGGGIADQSGRAILAQRDSGMTELSPVFERNRDWKMRVYRKVWARTRQVWTSERYIRLTDNPEAPTFLGLNTYGLDPATGQIVGRHVLAEADVDIILEEGPDTIIMQEELLEKMSNLGEAAFGPAGKIMVELSNVPNKDRLLEMIDKAGAPPPDVAAMQQRNAELEAGQKAAGIEHTQAQTLQALAAVGLPPPALGMLPSAQSGQMPPPGPPMDGPAPPPPNALASEPPPPGFGPGMPYDLPVDPQLAGIA